MDQTRWVRPLNTEPGHWKKQMPGKVLKLATLKDSAKLREYLQSNPDQINKQGPHGRTLLFEAIRKGRLDNVRYLLDRGANPNLTGCYNIESFVQLSGLASAKYYKRNQLEELLTDYGATWDIWRAAFCAENNLVESFLIQDSTLLNAEDDNDEIYLYSPLSFAIAGGNLPTAKGLLARGANLHIYGVQLLFISANNLRLDIVKWLTEEGVSAEQANSAMWSATNDLEILKSLVDAGLSARQERYSGLTPLHYVCRGDKGENVKKLQMVIDLEAEINALGPKGRTPLHYAAQGGYARSVEMLLAAGADKSIRDSLGQTALDLARVKKKSTVIEALQN